ncbi:MAG: RNA ligase family protein [Myxococcota bacterium]
MASVDTTVPMPAVQHLAWLAPGKPSDKVLPEGVARAILARPVIVEEKPDGALIAIDFADGTARVHYRATLLGPGAHPQFQPLWGWLAEREDALQRALGKERVLYGEWCYATHGLRHEALPDWFLASDVYDRPSSRFVSVDRRNALLKATNLSLLPEVARTKVDVKTLTGWLGSHASALGSPHPAGFVVRLEQGDHLVERALLVRAEVATAPEPSTRKTLERNTLAVRSG